MGRFQHRQPFAYAPILRACAGQIALAETPQTADYVILSHTKDLEELAPDLVALHRQASAPKIVLLSEEPFWDTIWGAAPFTRDQTYDGPAGSFPFAFLNHHTTSIYGFNQIPYYLLTDPVFALRYQDRFVQNARRSSQDWGAHFAKAPIAAAFIAEKRMNQKFAVRFPQHDTYGLCPFRSQLTQIYESPDPDRAVYRAGLGWRKGPKRQALEDWHLDKLQSLDQRCRFVSGLENTHQPNYLSEKLFDAFAVGAVPLFYASPQHRVHRLGLEGSWLNLFDMSPETACAAINRFAFSEPFLASYSQAQTRLATLFTDPKILADEYAQLVAALGDALKAVPA